MAHGDEQEERATAGTPPPEAPTKEALLTKAQQTTLSENCPDILKEYFGGIIIDSETARCVRPIKAVPGFFKETRPRIYLDDKDVVRFILKSLLRISIITTVAIHDTDDLFKALIFLYKYLSAIQDQYPEANLDNLLEASFLWNGLADRLPYLLESIFEKKTATTTLDIIFLCVTAMNAGIQRAAPIEAQWRWATNVVTGQLTKETATDKQCRFSANSKRSRLEANISYYNALFALLNRLSRKGVITGLSVTYLPSDAKDLGTMEAGGNHSGRKGLGSFDETRKKLLQKASGELSFNGLCIKYLDPDTDAGSGANITVFFTVAQASALTGEMLAQPTQDCWAELLTEKGYTPKEIAETVTSQATPAGGNKPETLPFAFTPKPSTFVALGMAGNYLKKGGEITDATISGIHNKNATTLFKAINKIATSDERKQRISSLFEHILETRAVNSDDRQTINDYLDTLSPSPATSLRPN